MAEAEEYDADDAATPVDPKDLKSSKGWLALITKAEKTFDTWQAKSDNIDKLMGNLERLSADVRDKEYQLFWANMQVLGPSIYSRPPVPVIVPRFKDQRPIPRTASEVLERTTVVTFETQDFDYAMRLVRDDLNTIARGVLWIRYEAKSEGQNNLGQRCCIEHVDRRDFVHDPARNWKEVDWVGKRSWLTKAEARKRFKKSSGKLYQDASYEIRKDESTDETDGKLKAGFWEIWSRSQDRVVWVAEGCDKLLDEGDPHLKLQDFFPTPRPAYGTIQRRSLIPVPDVMQYRDQLETINELTNRIHALVHALKLKGFYPGGASELSDAIEQAISTVDDEAILIPVSNWAVFGSGNPQNSIVWLPIADVANALVQCVTARQAQIGDVYQIMGLSDIMRGETDSNETLGAQQLKSQYGSVRIRDKKDELVRIARDVTRIVAEIEAEEFTQKSLLDMSQMDLPTDADIKKQKRELDQQAKALAKEIEGAKSDPEIAQMAQQNPEEAQKVMQQAQQQGQALAEQMAELDKTVTIDQVMDFLRENKTRTFVLDIETDSTIAPDEAEQKQAMSEYVTAMSGLFGQAAAVKEIPQLAPVMAAIIKQANSVFRVGRDFEQVIETFTDQMEAMAKAPPNEGPSPEQIKAQADQAALQAKQQSDAQRAQIEAGKAQAAAAKQQSDAQLAQAELQLRQQSEQATQQLAMAKLQGEQQAKAAQIEADKWKAQLQAVTAIKVAMIGAKTDMERVSLEAELESMLGIEVHQQEIERSEVEHKHEIELQAHDHEHQDVSQERSGEQSIEAIKAKPAPKPPAK